MQIEITSFDLMRLGVERDETREFADSVGVSVSSVEKWRREPSSDEAPHSTGIVNPVQHVDRIFDWLLIRHPDVALLLSERYVHRLRRFRERQSAQPSLSANELREQMSKVIDEHADIMKALVCGAPVADIRREVAEFNTQVETLLCRLENQPACPSALRKVGGAR